MSAGSWFRTEELAQQRDLARRERARALERQRQAEERAEEQEQLAEQRSARALLDTARAAVTSGELVRAEALLRDFAEVGSDPEALTLQWRISREPLLWQRRLRGSVLAADLSPDGSSLAAASAGSRTVYLFGLDDGSTRALRGHDRPTVSVRFARGGQWLVSTAGDGTLRAWDLASGAVEPAIEVADAGGPLAVSPLGDLIAAGRNDGRIRLWRAELAAAESGEPVADGGPRQEPGGPRFLGALDMFPPVTALVFDPAGERIVAGYEDGRVRFFELGDDELSRTIRAHRTAIRGLDLDPEGRWMATSGADRSVRLWRLADRDPEGEARIELPANIRRVRFSPGGARLAAGGGEAVHLWDREAERELGRIELPEGEVTTVSFSPGGERLVVGGSEGSIQLWHLGRTLARQPPSGHQGPAVGIAFSPDGRLLASGGADGTVRLWDVATGEQRGVYRNDPPAPISGVDYVNVDDEEPRIVSAATDGSVTLWDPDALGWRRRTFSSQTTVLISLDATAEREALVTGGTDGMVRLWFLRDGREHQGIYRHAGAAQAVAFCADGHLVASGGEDRAIRVMDLNMDWLWKSIDDLEGEVTGLAFSPDGRELAYAAGTEPVQIWRLATAEHTAIGPGGAGTNWLDFDPSGERLGLPRTDGTALIVRREGGETVTLRGHAGEVNSLRFSPDGALAATSGDDGTIRLWDATTGRPRWRAPALLRRAPRLLTHRGWLTVPGLEAAAARAGAEGGEDGGGDGADAGVIRGGGDAGLPRDGGVVEEAGDGGVEGEAGDGGVVGAEEVEGDGGDGMSGQGFRWRAAIVERGRFAAESASGELGCLVTLEDELELWLLGTDEQVRREPLAWPAEVVALDEGCLTLARGEVRLLRRDETRELAAGATAVASGGVGRVLVARDSEVEVVIAASGEVERSYAVGRGVRAMLALDQGLVLGFSDGEVELWELGEAAGRGEVWFEDAPAGVPVSLAASSFGLLAAGYDGGAVAIWNLGDGARLVATHVHGPVRHLRFVEGWLVAVSELGDARAVDLRAFSTTPPSREGP